MICPECGSDNLAETLIGWFGGINPNRFTCQDCKFSWFLHDLMESDADSYPTHSNSTY